MGKKPDDSALTPKKQWTDLELGKGVTMVLVDDNDGQSALIGGYLREKFGLTVLRDDTKSGQEKFKKWLAKESDKHNIRLICFDRETYWENGDGHALHHIAAHPVPIDVADTYRVGREIVKELQKDFSGLKDTEIFSISDHNQEHAAKPGRDRLFNRQRALAELKAGSGETVDYIRRALEREKGVRTGRESSTVGRVDVPKEQAPGWAKGLGYEAGEGYWNKDQTKGKPRGLS